MNTVYFVGTGMDENTHQFCDVLQKELQASGIEVIVAENILYNAENLKNWKSKRRSIDRDNRKNHVYRDLTGTAVVR